MDRVTPTITDILHQEEKKLAKFRRALRKEDQVVFDNLFVAAYKHRAASAYAGHLLSFETFLLSMTIETHREAMRVADLIHDVRRLRAEVAFVRRQLK